MQVTQRLDTLTSLRFIAAAMIVFSHSYALELFGSSKDQPFPVSLSQGVSFFFVLSGFILAYIYPKLETWPEVRRFWRARIARIWPALTVSLFIAYWLLSLEWDNKTGLANLFMVNAWIPFPIYFFSYNAPSWTISTEFFFYLAFPFLIYKWHKTWLIKLLVSGSIVIALISISNMLQLPTYVSINDESITRTALLKIHPVTRIFEFIFGMYVSTYWRKQVGCVQWSESRATLYEIGAILFAGSCMYFTGPLSKWVGNTWAGSATSDWFARSGSMLAFGLIIYIMAIGRGRIAAWLSHPILVLLGEISFSLYLLHLTFLLYYKANFPLFPALPNMLSLAIFWAVVLLASYVMWSLIEMPSRRLMLGSGQKDIHGTKVMQESWQSHFNLNQKTLSAAVALFCLVIPTYFLLGNNTNRISESEANAMTPSKLESVVGTGFGSLFKLRGVRIESKKEGLVIYLAWESLIEQKLTYSTGIFLTDINGNNLFNINLAQPITKTAEKEGSIWGESTLIPSGNLKGWENKLAIVVYQGDSEPLLIDRGDRDWDNHRLLIDLGDAMYPTSLK